MKVYLHAQTYLRMLSADVLRPKITNLYCVDVTNFMDLQCTFADVWNIIRYNVDTSLDKQKARLIPNIINFKNSKFTYMHDIENQIYYAVLDICCNWRF